MDHLLNDLNQQKGTIETDRLTKVTDLSKQLVLKNKELKQLEQGVKDKKKECAKLSQDLIPQSMEGIKSLTLTTGETVSCKKDISCTIKSHEEFYDFINRRGDGNLMQVTFALGTIPKDIRDKIEAMLLVTFGISVESKLYVHKNSLNAYFRRLCGIADTKCEVPLASIDEEMVSIFPYFKTNIK